MACTAQVCYELRVNIKYSCSSEKPSQMKVITADIPGILIIEPKLFVDQRGFFLETYHLERYVASGIVRPFVQDNLSRSDYVFDGSKLSPYREDDIPAPLNVYGSRKLASEAA